MQDQFDYIQMRFDHDDEADIRTVQQAAFIERFMLVIAYVSTSAALLGIAACAWL